MATPDKRVKKSQSSDKLCKKQQDAHPPLEARANSSSLTETCTNAYTVTLAGDRLRGLQGNLLLDTTRYQQVHKRHKQHLSVAQPEHLNSQATLTQQMRRAAPVLSADAGSEGSGGRTTTDHFQDSVWRLASRDTTTPSTAGRQPLREPLGPMALLSNRGCFLGTTNPCPHHLTLLSSSQRITESY